MHSDFVPESVETAPREHTGTSDPTSTPLPAPRWDPQQYLHHSGHRTRPFLDLLARIPALPGPSGAAAADPAAARGASGARGVGAPRLPDVPHGPGTRPPARIADLGCGPGNVTALLADRWPDARVTGFDLSPEMLAQADKDHAGTTSGGGWLDFRPADLAHWTPDEPYDLIVSNAALQWVPNHPESFACWIDGLTPGGTLAFQVPGNFTSPSHALLGELCESPRWRARLRDHGRRYVHILEPADYLLRLTDLGCEADAWETTYSQLLYGQDPVLDWVKGTALRPALTALADDEEATEAFLAEYRDLLRRAYPPGPHGTVFPFRRIFAVARRKDR
ncbi:methyltransferase domain-containing protein [Streptomyces sp. TLI_146]|uniref:methyltransferase domain-containing protein n=1 Tax=Streptomyces sp. TLI_146 TaxID=1938858 RepID=UPI000C70F99C|nr:methyltransferase domain-containing protein [Streptomyces sp. TLI_146]PKV86190.1 trans-aconitate 2-methyltransferase [Streptomyces sp. TLI_146]